MSIPLAGQQPESPTAPAPIKSEDDTLSHPNETNFLKHLAVDQKDIWTSPLRLQPKDATWLVPMGGIATGLFVTDPASSFGMASYHPQTYVTAGNAGLFAAAGRPLRLGVFVGPHYQDMDILPYMAEIKIYDGQRGCVVHDLVDQVRRPQGRFPPRSTRA
ncbi:MAG TPA: hypothetical protein VIH91_07255 [Terriglobales bacterium]